MSDDNQTTGPEANEIPTLESLEKEKEELLKAAGQPESEAVTEESKETKEPVEDNSKESEDEDVLAKLEKGDKLSPEEIKEIKDGYLRRADYTRKTQEVADMRKEFEGSFEKEAPKKSEVSEEEDDIAKRLSGKFASREEIEPLLREIRAIKFNSKIDSLQKQYGDNFQEVLTEARKIFETKPDLKKDIDSYDLVFQAASAKVISESAREEGAKAVEESGKAAASTRKASKDLSTGHTDAEIAKMSPDELLELLGQEKKV